MDPRARRDFMTVTVAVLSTGLTGAVAVVALIAIFAVSVDSWNFPGGLLVTTLAYMGLCLVGQALRRRWPNGGVAIVSAGAVGLLVVALLGILVITV